MTKKAEKKFDAVRTMREIRDRLSREIQGMTFEDEKRFLRDRVPSRASGHPKKLPDKAMHSTGLAKRRSGQSQAAEGFVGKARG